MNARFVLNKRSTLLACMAIALSVVAVVGTVASAAVKPRTFTLVMSPGTVSVGSNQTFSAVITNTGTYPLGSVDLQAPAPVIIHDVGSTLGGSSFAGRIVHLRDLSLPPGGSFSASIDGTIKCNAYPSLAWKPTGWQGNDGTGSAFTLKAAGSSKTMLSTGHCSLRFVADHQPNDAHPSAKITDTPFDTGGGPVQVEILDAANDRATGVSGTVVVAIGTNPGGGTLAGTKSRPAIAGVASYTNLSIDKTSIGYTLVASSNGLGTATSDPFTIAQLGVDCVPFEDCFGDLSDSTTSAEVDAIADSSAPRLTMSLTAGGPNCDEYTEHSSTLEFGVTSTRAKQVTLGFDTGLDPYFVQPGDFQVCYQSPTSFVDRDGATVTLGLLPDCDPYGDPVSPCVLDRSADGSFVFITFVAPQGDPKGRV